MGHTMREVAKRAGVSPATVSRVLNKTQHISTEMEQRVLEVVRQLNYYKNVHARRLATGQSDLFGLVISEIATPFFSEIIRGFQAAAGDRGLDVLLCNTEYNQSRTKSVIRKLIESDVRGVAIVTSSVARSGKSAWWSSEEATSWRSSLGVRWRKRRSRFPTTSQLSAFMLSRSLS